MANPNPIFHWGTAVPTGTAQFYDAGTLIKNSAPGFGKVVSWQATVAGRPGTWIALDLAEGNTISLISAAAALAAGAKLTVSTDTGEHTLPEADTVAALAEVVLLCTNGSGCTVAAAAGDTLVGSADIATTRAGRFASNGVDKWYRV